MRPLPSIYSHRVSGFMETQVGFNPIQKRNSNPKRKVQTRLSVDRPVDRPMPRLTGPVDRAYPRASPCQSVDRSRSTAPSCTRSCTPVDWAVDSSTGRPGSRPGALLACSMRRFSLPLSSDLCAISFHLLYLLSPTFIIKSNFYNIELR